MPSVCSDRRTSTAGGPASPMRKANGSPGAGTSGTEAMSVRL